MFAFFDNMNNEIYNYYAVYIFIKTNTIHILTIIFSTLFIVPYLSTLMKNQGEDK